MTARPIRRNAQTPDRNGKIFYTSTTSLSHISKIPSLIVLKPSINNIVKSHESKKYRFVAFYYMTVQKEHLISKMKRNMHKY